MIPIKYNVRSLFVRSGTTLMTVGSIAFVVLVYIGVLALAGGLRASFRQTGDPATVIVMRDGARSETESGFSTETHRILAAMPGIVKDNEGRPIASGETVHLQVLRRADSSETNVPIRGVHDEAFALRPQVRITEGRRFSAGKNEVMVGVQMARRNPALRPGNEVKLGRLPFRIVGVFSAAGSAYESEVWGAVDDLGNSYRRPNYFSSTRLRAASSGAVPDLIARIKADQRLRLDPVSETEYMKRQTAASTAMFVVLGNALAILMAFGACFAAANTMYAQVAARGRELGTLRALGFRRRSLLSAFLIEAIALGLLAGGVGAVLSLPLNRITAETMISANFSSTAYALRTSPSILVGGVVLAALTGIIGGLAPAVSASRQRITELLREA